MTWVAELAQGLGLDLTNPLSGDTELASDLIQRVSPSVFQTKAHLDDTPFLWTEGSEDIGDFFVQELVCGRVQRGQRSAVLNEIPQVPIFFVADGHLQGQWLLCDAQDAFHIAQRDVQLFSYLFGSGLASQLLCQLARIAGQAVDPLIHVDRDTDGAPVVGNCAGDGLRIHHVA